MDSKRKIETKMYKRILRNLALAIGVLVMSFVFAPKAQSKVAADMSALDTIAGFATSIQIEYAKPNAEYIIETRKPNGAKLILETTTDKDGSASIKFSSKHTKQAGKYTLSLLSRSGKLVDSDLFLTLPGSVSEEKSEINAENKTVEADGNGKTYIAVRLTDKYDNPIEGHSVKLVSSRSEDDIDSINKGGVTEEDGLAIFEVRSDIPGISTFTAYDTTADLILDDREKVIFFSEEAYGIGGEDDFTFSKLLAQATGPVHHLEIEDLPESIELNATVSFTLTAYDIDDQLNTNYSGSVEFTSSDLNADLPSDYTFDVTDQGSHTFTLATKFRTTGLQTLDVQDIDDSGIIGSFEIFVIGPPEPEVEDFVELELTLPTEGVYSSNTIQVSGFEDTGLTINVFDNDELVDSADVQPDNSFSFTLSGLAGGEHAIYVESTFDGNVVATSEEIVLIIDVEGAQLFDVSIRPVGDVGAGSIFNLSVFSEPNLERVSVILDNEIFDLTESLSQSGVYESALTAPEEIGDYGIDVILVDELGNEVSYKDARTVTVSDIVEIEVPARPENVTGLSAAPGDGRVTLSWEIAQPGSSDTFIDHYRVYVGPNPEEMFTIINTFDSATTWYVPGLINGKIYYFSVTAVDNEGNESMEVSNIVASSPITKEATVEDILAELRGTVEETISIEEVAEFPAAVPETGPMMWFLFPTAFIPAHLIARRKRKV